MRRSGITSRSKCASFSISQMSWSKAGPRGPAVMMLVLSATGDPVALVKRLSVAMIGSSVRARSGPLTSRLAWLADGWRSFSVLVFGRLPAPSRSSNDTAEISVSEVRILVRQHVGVDVAEGRLRPVLVAVVEGLDDVFLEMGRTRMCMHHSLALRVAVLPVFYAEHIHFDAGGDQSYDRVHVLRDARRRVQGDRRPDHVYILLFDAVASQKVASSIRAVDLEPFLGAAVLVCQTHVMKHRAGVEQFCIELE